MFEFMEVFETMFEKTVVVLLALIVIVNIRL